MPAQHGDDPRVAVDDLGEALLAVLAELVDERAVHGDRR
jgi:hypothetical protein